MEYVSEFARGVMGRFRRRQDGTLECLGLALSGDHAMVAKLLIEPEATPGHVRLRDGEQFIRTGPSGASITSRAMTGEEILDEAAETLRSADETILRADTQLRLRALGFVDRACQVCSKTFSTTGTRDVCDEHAHLGESR